jgi:hypothetical protein
VSTLAAQLLHYTATTVQAQNTGKETMIKTSFTAVS